MNGGPIRIVFIGDSHGLMWARVLEEICRKNSISAALNLAANTDPFFEIPATKTGRSTERFTAEQKAAFDLAKLRLIRECDNVLLLITCRWSGYWKNDEQIDAIVELVQEERGQVLLLEQPPELGVGNVNIAQFLGYSGFGNGDGEVWLRAGNLENHSAGRDFIEQRARKFENCSIFRTCDWFLDPLEPRVKVVENSSVYYFDDDHLSNQGAVLLSEALEKKILGLLE